MDTYHGDEGLTAETLEKFNNLVKAALRLGIPVFPADSTRLLSVARLMSRKKLSSRF